MSRAIQFERKLIKDRFFAEAGRPDIAREEPCIPLERTDTYICSRDGRFKLLRLPTDNELDSYKRLKADHDMTGVFCPISPNRGKIWTRAAYRAVHGEEPEWPAYPKPRPILTYPQVKEAQRVLALWRKWDESGKYPYLEKELIMPKRFRKRHIDPPVVTV